MKILFVHKRKCIMCIIKQQSQYTTLGVGLAVEGAFVGLAVG